MNGDRLHSTRRGRPRLLTAASLLGVTLALPPAAQGAAAVSLAVGSKHVCVLTTSGGVRCWGDNQYGQLGDGTQIGRSAPVDVIGLQSGVAAITTSGNHTCALTSAGAVKCWGKNGSGQLGDASTENRLAPVDVVGLGSGVTGISAGSGHTCAVTGAGAVKCWGFNFSGQVGVPVAEDDRVWSVPAPAAVVGLETGAASVVAGSEHSCAITTGGALKCWGSNRNGQLGFDLYYYPDTRVPAFEVVGLGSGVASVALGADHTCAVMVAGRLQCWGSNFRGQLGDGTEIERLVPTDVQGLTTGTAAVAAGLFHTCALTQQGAVSCWGDNERGQLGDGASARRPVGKTVNGLSSGIAALSAKFDNTCVLTASGDVKCWGPNDRGQLGEGRVGSVPQRTAGCVVGLGDSDADRICDVADPCAGRRRFARSVGPTLTLRRVNTDPTRGDEAVSLRGRFVLPPGTSFADLDPLADGMRLTVVSPGGSEGDFAFPAGSYGGSGTSGWQLSASGDRWRFRDATGAPGAASAASMTLWDESEGAERSLVALNAILRRVTLPVEAADLPLQAIVVLGDDEAGAAGLCVQTSFGPRTCAFDVEGDGVECRLRQRS
jgi:alpha-tubulin suppressor-like RCC1 family protein